MKAHRRNGIPTLMLRQGGAPSTEAERIARQIGPYAKRALEPTFDYLLDIGNLASKASRYVFDPYVDLAKGLAKKEFEREKRLRASFEEQEMNRRANALRDIRRGIPGLLTPSDPYQLKTARGIAKKVAPIPSMQDYRNAARSPSYEESITDALISASRAEANSQLPPNFLEPIKQEAARLEALRSPFSDPAMSVQDELMKSALESSQAKRSNLAKAQAEAKTQTQRAADALSGGVLRPQTTSAPAAAEAAQQDQEGAAATGVSIKPEEAAAIVSEGPEEEALRQATGAPTQAEEAAAAAAEKGSPSPTTNPTVVTSIQSTISDIMGGEAAQFDEGKRLQELKDTFGLGPTDMEKAAPGLAFAFSLMGAQRAPGESPFNALVRAAGSAGEAATKSNLALQQRERAIDLSLASTVLQEQKAAEQYARSKEWVAVWNGGFDKNGMAKAEYLRMNADQIQKANEAGLQIVPINVVSTATTAFATRSRAAAQATSKLNEQIRKTFDPTSVKMTFLTNRNETVDGRRLKGFDPTDGRVREVVIADDVSGQGRLVGNLLKDSAATLSLVNEMDGLIDQSTGVVNVASALSEKTMSLLGLGENATAEDLYRAASEKGGVAFSNLSGFAKNKINVDNAYNELGADGVKRLLNIQGDFSEQDLKKRLSENINNVRGQKPIEKPGENAGEDVKSAYQARVRFRAIQNALAAQLAPILLGESGRTISDADRVRVIALLGGFSDFSKAGVLTTAEEMRESTRMLREILGKYKDSALQDADRMISSFDEASSYISPITKGAIYSPSRDDEEVIFELRGAVQAFKKPNAGQAGQTSGVSPVSANKLLGK